MFRLSIVDHIRLSFGHVVQNYTVHIRAAERQAAAAMYARTVVPALLACAAALSVAVLLGAGRYTQIAAAVASAMAFLAYAVVASLGLEERMLAHRFMANRLWMLCERYRALLAEIHDGLLEPDAIRMRRDDLIREFHQIVEQAALPHRSAQGAAGRAAWSEASLTEAQIDQFLPESLRQTTTPAPAEATAGNG
ncbi:MAG TPA: SLATT domain-containing protein [Vicinamibacterales bacterium]|nr:SLATT domain-containing protein [Vicinamibacterales bacterium]